MFLPLEYRSCKTNMDRHTGSRVAPFCQENSRRTKMSAFCWSFTERLAYLIVSERSGMPKRALSRDTLFFRVCSGAL